MVSLPEEACLPRAGNHKRHEVGWARSMLFEAPRRACPAQDHPLGGILEQVSMKPTGIELLPLDVPATRDFCELVEVGE